MVITIDTGMILALVKIINWIIHAMDFLEKKSAKVAILLVAIWIIAEGTYVWLGL